MSSSSSSPSTYDRAYTHVRSFLLRWVLSGTSTVVAFQRLCGVTTDFTGSEKKKGSGTASPSPSPSDPAPTIRSPFLYTYFLTAAAAGNELFYIIALPLLFWCVDVELARRICILWGMIYYVGQSVKDMGKLPRPPSPPVTKLERHYETEYGFPSTHAMVSISLPFYAVYVWESMGNTVNWPICLSLCAWWCVSITLSRLYVGVHSVCDLSGGLLLGILVMLFGQLVGPAIDTFLITAPLSPLIAFVVSWLAISFYPAPAEWTNAFGDTALIIAVVAGIAVASSRYFEAFEVPAFAIEGVTLSEQLHSVSGVLMTKLVRMLIGCSILFLTRAAVKKMAQMVWLPFVMPRYFSFLSLLPSPVHEVREDSEPDSTSPPGSPLACAANSEKSGEWQLTHMDTTATQRGTMLAAQALTQRDRTEPAAAALIPPIRPASVPLPPQQFRWQVPSRSSSPPPPRSPSPLSALLSSTPSSSQHQLLTDGPIPLVQFEVAGRQVTINPLHIYLVEIPIKYVTYFAVGFNAVYVAPALFKYLGI